MTFRYIDTITFRSPAPHELNIPHSPRPVHRQRSHLPISSRWYTDLNIKITIPLVQVNNPLFVLTSNSYASTTDIRSISQHVGIALSHNSISDLIAICTFHAIGPYLEHLFCNADSNAARAFILQILSYYHRRRTRTHSMLFWKQYLLPAQNKFTYVGQCFHSVVFTAALCVHYSHVSRV